MKKLVAIFLFSLLVFWPNPIFASGGTTHATSDIGDAEAIPLIIGQLFGFNVANLIMPMFQGDKTIGIPNVHPFAAFTKNVNKLTISETLKPAIVNYSEKNENPVSAKYCTVLVIRTPWGKVGPIYALSTGTEVSANFPFSQMYVQNAETLASVWGLWQKEVNEQGKLDFNWPTHIVATISPEDCRLQDVGNGWNPISNDVGSLAQVNAELHGEISGGIPGAITQAIANALKAAGELLPKVNISYEFTATRKQSISHTHKGGVFTGDPTDLDTDDATAELAKTRGWTAGLLPEQRLSEKIVSAAQTTFPILFNLSFDRGKKPLNFDTEYNAINNGSERTKQGVCAAVPEDFISGQYKDTYKIGDGSPPPNAPTGASGSTGPQTDDVSFVDACGTTETCKVDTYQEILQKLPKTINATCTKYLSRLPISQDQCVGMMNEIFNIEIRNDPEWSGANYRCEHRQDSTAAGPFQIIDETYGIVSSCSQEHMSDDLKGCKTKETQLSRCITEDATELAMRVILHSSNCNNIGTIGSTSELYTAVCNYGTGTQQLPWLGGQTYCEDVFKAAGIPIP